MATIIITDRIYNFKDHTKGDTFNSRNFTFPFVITGCEILMQFRLKSISANLNPVAFEWKSNDDTFEIINSTQAIMKFRILDVPIGKYEYDLQIKFTDGIVYTYFKGDLIITKEISIPS